MFDRELHARVDLAGNGNAGAAQVFPICLARSAVNVANCVVREELPAWYLLVA
jgi:hypothetical protein